MVPLWNLFIGIFSERTRECAIIMAWLEPQSRELSRKRFKIKRTGEDMKKFLLAVIFTLAALPLMATSVVFVSKEDSVRLSELILIGNVTKVETTYDKQGQIVRNI